MTCLAWLLSHSEIHAAWQFEAWKTTSLTLSCVEGPRSGATEPLIAAGEGGTLLVSRNNQWSSVNTGTENWLRAAHAISNTWVVVGDNGTILSSTNLALFSHVHFPSNPSWISVLHNAGLWILLSDTGLLATTPDFVSWETNQIPSPGSTRFRSLNFGDGLFLAGGLSGSLFRSSDLRSWDPVPLPTRLQITDIAYGGRAWLIATETNLWSSEDTLDWTPITLPRPEFIRSLKWIGFNLTTPRDGIWVAAGNNGSLFASVFQAPWTEVILPPTTREVAHDLHCIRFFSGEWTVVGARGTVWKCYSQQGQRARPELGSSWIPFQARNNLEFLTTTANDQNAVILGTGLLQGDTGAGMTSVAGTLSQANVGIQTPNLAPLNITASSTDGRTWVAVGDLGQAFLSFNLSSWAALDQTVNTQARPELNNAVTGLDTTLNLHSVASNSRFWITVGERGMIRKSDTNGYIWTSVRSPASNSLHTVQYAAGRWIAAGENQIIITSLNGLDWERVHFEPTDSQPSGLPPELKPLPPFWEVCPTSSSSSSNQILIRPSAPTPSLRALAKSTKQWVAVGDQGTVLNSLDGISWNPAPNLGDKSLFAIAFFQNQGLCGGLDGSLYESSDGGDTWRSLRRQSKTTWRGIVAQRRGTQWWWLVAGGNFELLARPIINASEFLPYQLQLVQQPPADMSTPPQLELQWPGTWSEFALLESHFPNQLFEPSNLTIQRRGGLWVAPLALDLQPRRFYRLVKP